MGQLLNPVTGAPIDPNAEPIKYHVELYFIAFIADWLASMALGYTPESTSAKYRTRAATAGGWARLRASAVAGRPSARRASMVRRAHARPNASQQGAPRLARIFGWRRTAGSLSQIAPVDFGMPSTHPSMSSAWM